MSFQSVADSLLPRAYESRRSYYMDLAREQFPSMPESVAKALASFLCKSTGVMQNEELSPPQAMQRAVRAYIRHNHTDYESNFAELDRQTNREIVGRKVETLYQQWRQGYVETPQSLEPLPSAQSAHPWFVTYTRPSTGERHTHPGSSQASLMAKINAAKLLHPNHQFHEIYTES